MRKKTNKKSTVSAGGRFSQRASGKHIDSLAKRKHKKKLERIARQIQREIRRCH